MREQIEQVLTDIHKALLNGDLDLIAELAHWQDQAMTAIGPEVEPDRLTRILTAARRNQRLISAARDGLLAARRDLDAAALPRSPIRTYGPGGQARNIGATPTAIERQS